MKAVKVELRRSHCRLIAKALHQYADNQSRKLGKVTAHDLLAGGNLTTSGFEGREKRKLDEIYELVQKFEQISSR